MHNISANDVKRAFERFVGACERAGFPNTDRYAMSTGSKTYGHAFRVYSVKPESGAHMSIPMVESMGYIGMTKREAYETLHTLARAIDATADAVRKGN